jgi:hypothetical protein
MLKSRRYRNQETYILFFFTLSYMTNVEWGTESLGTWTNASPETTLGGSVTNSWSGHRNAGIILSNIGSGELTLECSFPSNGSSYGFVGVNPSSTNPEQPTYCYFCFYFEPTGTGVRCMVNEDWTRPISSYDGDDVFKLVFSTTEVKFYMNDVIQRTVATTATSGDFRICCNAYNTNDRFSATYSMGPPPGSATTFIPPPIAHVRL